MSSAGDPGALRQAPSGPGLAATAGRMLVALWRTGGLFAMTAALGIELSIAYAVRGRQDPLLGPRYMQRWCSAATRLFKAHVIPSGTVPRAAAGSSRGVLLVCNHRTYADIPAVGSQLPVVFVSMAELAGWPIIGWGGRLVGTIFVDRKDPESRRAVRGAVIDRLSRGLCVLNFPEGKLWGGRGLGPFSPGLFRAVAGADLDLVPVTLRYGDAYDHAEGPKKPFLETLLETAAGPPVEVHVHFGDPVSASDFPDPARLLAAVRARMLEQLGAVDPDPSSQSAPVEQLGAVDPDPSSGSSSGPTSPPA